LKEKEKEKKRKGNIENIEIKNMEN